MTEPTPCDYCHDLPKPGEHYDHYSPDMDIMPVALCRLCLIEITFGIETGGGATKRKERNDLRRA